MSFNIMKGNKFTRWLLLIGCLWGLVIPNAQAGYYFERYVDNYECHWLSNFLCDELRDFRTYFEPCNLLMLGNVIIIGGIFANTGLDRSIQREWQEDIRGPGVNSFLKPFETIGGYSIWYIPFYLGVMGVGKWLECCNYSSVVYEWGYRSIRTYILGGIQVAILGPVLGGGRPNDGEDSKWQPFRRSTGVSGHAFTGSIPFLTAAFMTDPPVLRLTLFILSTLPGFARVNFNKHYFSQVFIGWSIAYLSAKAVYNSDLSRPRFQIGPYPCCNGVGVYGTYRF